jgi:IS4 transposase
MRHRNCVLHGVLRQVPWRKFDALVEAHQADKHVRELPTKTQFVSLAFAQLCGISGLRETVTALNSQTNRLYHLGARPVARSTLSDANTLRPSALFEELFAFLVSRAHRGLRRTLDSTTYLIDSTSAKLNQLSADWARFSVKVCGAKVHVIYDPNANQPIYAAFSTGNVNDTIAAHDMPIEPGAIYVFDLGYYDYGWWAKLHGAGCRIVSRLKGNTPFAVLEDRPVPAGSSILSDRTGHLPSRLAASRRNPMSALVREVQVVAETGKVLRIFTNDLTASAQDIADLYKRRWAIELFFRWIKQVLKITHFLGTSENAVRIQIVVALIAFLLLRMAHDTNRIVRSPLAFARLIRANLMHRRSIAELLAMRSAPDPQPQQTTFEFGSHATKVAQRRRAARACPAMRMAA